MVTVNAFPAVVLVGAPLSVMLAVGAAFTVVVCELVNVLLAVSVAVTVCEPAVTSLTPFVKVWLPLSPVVNGKLGGTDASVPASLVVKWTVPVYAFGPLATFPN